MNKRIIIIIMLALAACQSPKPEPRKPIAPEIKPAVKIPYQSITSNTIASAVLYEANIRQYSEEGTFNAFAKDLPVLKDMGVKILWLMPVNPISTTKSKGPLGSYYAVSDYKKVNPEFGTLADFKALVQTAHDLGIYVILDWVPGHTGWDHAWIKENSDFYLKNRRGEIIDPINPFTGKSFGWTDVADLNYNNMEMRQAMTEALVYWVKETGIDGFRFDQAYAVPQKFYDNAFAAINEIKPVFLLAETDIYHPGGIDLVSKFDATYDWPGHQLTKDIVQGKKTAVDYHKHVRRVLRNYGEENILVNFVSNHDENSWQGTISERYGDAAHAFMALSYTTPGMPLIYSGQEYDLNKRLLFFEKDSFPKVQGKTLRLLKKLGSLKNNHAALASGIDAGSFKSLYTSKNNQIFAFQRGKDGDTLVVLSNLSKEYAQFTMPFNGTFKRYQDNKTKILSESYEYVMKPWEFWILTK